MPKNIPEPNEIIQDLDGYELVKNIKSLRQFDKIKYLRKDNAKYIKSGTLISGNYEKKTILVKQFFGNGKKILYTINLNDIILFKKL